MIEEKHAWANMYVLPFVTQSNDGQTLVCQIVGPIPLLITARESG